MTKSAVIAEAMNLSPEDREDLALKLLDSLVDVEPAGTDSVAMAEWESAWRAEVERRVADLDAGRAVTVPADVAIAKLRALLADNAS
jgi:putative addiction module component (TIGR02574 family)